MVFRIVDLMEMANENRNLQSFEPDEQDHGIPASVFKYKPVIWEEDGVWHTLLGSLPDKGIWVLGTSPLESMQEFDKELQYRLKGNGDIVPITEEERQKMHKEVFKKIDTI